MWKRFEEAGSRQLARPVWLPSEEARAHQKQSATKMHHSLMHGKQKKFKVSLEVGAGPEQRGHVAHGGGTPLLVAVQPLRKGGGKRAPKTR